MSTVAPKPKPAPAPKPAADESLTAAQSRPRREDAGKGVSQFQAGAAPPPKVAREMAEKGEPTA